MQNNLIKNEVDANYAAFKEMLPQIEQKNGKFALMKGKRIVNFYDTFGDAKTTGSIMFSDGVFSVQKVTSEPVNLGFFSNALHIR